MMKYGHYVMLTPSEAERDVCDSSGDNGTNYATVFGMFLSL